VDKLLFGAGKNGNIMLIINN